MTIAGVIFDLDGLLSDTERLHCRAYRQTLAGLGVELSDAEFAAHWIRDGKGIADFCALRRLPHDPMSIRRAKAVAYRELVETCVEPMPGAVDCLRRLHGRFRLAVGTSAFGGDALAVLRRLDIERFFDVFVSGSDVNAIKPAPDIFLLAAERLHVPPMECVVIEDAEKGIRAAAAAGMRAIAVPSEHTRGNDFTMAWRVVGSLDEVDERLIASAGDFPV